MQRMWWLVNALEGKNFVPDIVSQSQYFGDGGMTVNLWTTSFYSMATKKSKTNNNVMAIPFFWQVLFFLTDL